MKDLVVVVVVNMLFSLLPTFLDRYVNHITKMSCARMQRAGTMRTCTMQLHPIDHLI